MKNQHNVFIDLGFPPAEADNLSLRADLMIAVAEEIRRRRLTRSVAAKLLDVPPARVSDLLHGNIELFSVEELLPLARAAGIRVDVRIKRPAA